MGLVPALASAQVQGVVLASGMEPEWEWGVAAELAAACSGWAVEFLRHAL
jgi:hypothetical protein